MAQNRILLVEDDPLLVKLYSDILTSAGLTFKAVAEGNQAYDEIKKGGWELVLLDYILPNLTALQILDKLKLNQPLTPNKKIVLMTNMDKDEDVKKALTMTQGYIVKSNLNPEEFLNKVKDYLK